MLKLFLIIYLLLTVGCQPATSYTTHSDYVETWDGDKEKGLVTSSKASWGVEWKS